MSDDSLSYNNNSFYVLKEILDNLRGKINRIQATILINHLHISQIQTT
jgi:hypothetical protein